MQRERHQRLGANAAAVITIAKTHGVSVDELMASLGEVVEAGTELGEHAGHQAAVVALAEMPALKKITWPKRPATAAELKAQRQADWQADNAERVKKKLAARELEAKRQAEAAELAAAEAAPNDPREPDEASGSPKPKRRRRKKSG